MVSLRLWSIPQINVFPENKYSVYKGTPGDLGVQFETLDINFLNSVNLVSRVLISQTKMQQSNTYPVLMVLLGLQIALFDQ